MSRSRKKPINSKTAKTEGDANVALPNDPKIRLDEAAKGEAEPFETKDFFADETGEDSVFTEPSCDDFPQFFARMAKEKAERTAIETGADFSGQVYGEEVAEAEIFTREMSENETDEDSPENRSETAYEAATRKFPYSRAAWEDEPWPQDLSKLDADRNGYLKLGSDNSPVRNPDVNQGSRGAGLPSQDGGEGGTAGWSNSAKSALGEMLNDIHNEQAERASRRDMIAARVSKRRTTGPVTALIVALLVVVVAYSLRNFDGANSPDLIRNAATLLNKSAGAEQEVNPAEMIVASNEVALPVADPTSATAEPVRSTSIPAEIEEGVGGTLVPLAEAESVSRPQSNEIEIDAGQFSGEASSDLFVEPVRLVQPKLATAVQPYDPAPKMNADEGPSLALMPSSAEPKQARATGPSPDKMPPAAIASPAPEQVGPSRSEVINPKMANSGAASSDLAVSGIDSGGSADEVGIAKKKVASTAPDVMFSAMSREASPVVPDARLGEKNNEAATSSGVNSTTTGDTELLLHRAEEMLGMRDLVSARLLFERAASHGSAEGQFGAGKTYDPLCFEKLGVHGVPAEPQKAMSHYRSAASAGHSDAKKYLGLLQSWVETNAPLQAANR